MLRRTERLSGYEIRAKDAEVREIEDFDFDDVYRIVRYLVAETRGWPEQERTLLAPRSLGETNWLAGILPVDLTAEQIEANPPTDCNKPIAREHEFQLHTRCGWECYRLSLESPVPITREYEESLHDYYARPKYWM